MLQKQLRYKNKLAGKFKVIRYQNINAHTANKNFLTH